MAGPPGRSGRGSKDVLREVAAHAEWPSGHRPGLRSGEVVVAGRLRTETDSAPRLRKPGGAGWWCGAGLDQTAGVTGSEKPLTSTPGTTVFVNTFGRKPPEAAPAGQYPTYGAPVRAPLRYSPPLLSSIPFRVKPVTLPCGFVRGVT